MLQVELVLAGPDPKSRWKPLDQLSEERRAAYHEWEEGEVGRQKKREERREARTNFVQGVDFDRNGDGVVSRGSAVKVSWWVAVPRVAQGFVRHVVLTTAFDNIVLAWIVASCVVMAADSPLYDPSSDRAKTLFNCESAVVVAFSGEMALRMIALGRCPIGKSKGAPFSVKQAARMSGRWEPFGYFYTRVGGYNWWNWADCFVTLTSAFSLSIQGSTLAHDLSTLRPLRVLRALRPLRLLSKQRHMRVVVSAIMTSLTAVGPLMLILVVFFLSFAIVAVRFLKGRFFACKGSEFDALTADQRHFITYPIPYTDLTPTQQAWADGIYGGGSSPTSEDVCGWLGAKWRHVLPYTFDNVFSGFGTLMMICTTEHYDVVMYAAIDSRAIGMQPVRGSNPQWAFFFLAMIIFGSFFLMRLVVAVVIQHYRQVTAQDEKARGSGQDGLASAATDEELRWIHMQEMMLSYATVQESRLSPPSWVCLINRLCFELAYGCFAVVTANFIYFCIIANTLLMCARHFGQPVAFDQVCVIAQESFACIFMAEVVIKLLAIGPAYFKDNWNNFDFIVGVGGFATVVAKHVSGVNGGTFVSLLRVLRLGRIIRLLERNKQLRELLGTIILAIAPLGSLTAVMALFYFMYAAMGVQLFAKVRLVSSMTRGLNEGYNFQSFYQALVALLPPKKNGAMHELANWEGTECTVDPQWDPSVCGFYLADSSRRTLESLDGCVPIDGCGSWLAYPYMMSFYWFISFIILNLFTAVIIKEYENALHYRVTIANTQQEVSLAADKSDDGKPDKVGLTRTEYSAFCSEWAKVDPDFTWEISRAQLYQMLISLPPPLGFAHSVMEMGAGEAAAKKEMAAGIDDLMQDYEEEWAEEGKADEGKAWTKAGSFVERTTGVVLRSKFNFRAVCAMLARHAVKVMTAMPREMATTHLAVRHSSGKRRHAHTVLGRLARARLHHDKISVPRTVKTRHVIKSTVVSLRIERAACAEHVSLNETRALTKQKDRALQKMIV
jgi:hypothetical protein